MIVTWKIEDYSHRHEAIDDVMADAMYRDGLPEGDEGKDSVPPMPAFRKSLRSQKEGENVFPITGEFFSNSNDSSSSSGSNKKRKKGAEEEDGADNSDTRSSALSNKKKLRKHNTFPQAQKSSLSKQNEESP